MAGFLCFKKAGAVTQKDILRPQQSPTRLDIHKGPQYIVVKYKCNHNT